MSRLQPCLNTEVHARGRACYQEGGQEAQLLHLPTTKHRGLWLTVSGCVGCACGSLRTTKAQRTATLISRVAGSFLALQSVRRQTHFLKAAKYAKVLLKMCKINKYTSQMNKHIFKFMKWEDAWNRPWCVRVQSSPDGLSVEAWLWQSRKDF